MDKIQAKRLAWRDRNGVVREVTLEGEGSGGGKRTCRFVVGTSTAGWTAADCDFLCDGVDDQEEIKEAIMSANDNGGGEVIVLNGTYNISGQIAYVAKNVVISGSGATVFQKVISETGYFGYGMLILAGSDFTVKNIIFDGAGERKDYERAIILSGARKAIIKNNTFRNCALGCIQIEYGRDCIIEGNLFGTSNYSRVGIFDCEQIVVKSNIARRDDEGTGYDLFAYIQNCKKIVVQGNISDRYGVRLLGSKQCLICENILGSIVLETHNEVPCTFNVILGNSIEKAMDKNGAGDGNMIDGNVIYTEG